MLAGGVQLSKLLAGGVHPIAHRTDMSWEPRQPGNADHRDPAPSPPAAETPRPVGCTAPPYWRRGPCGRPAPERGPRDGRQHLLRAVLRHLLHPHRPVVGRRREAPALAARPRHAAPGRVGLPRLPAPRPDGPVRADRRQREPGLLAGQLRRHRRHRLRLDRDPAAPGPRRRGRRPVRALLVGRRRRLRGRGRARRRPRDRPLDRHHPAAGRGHHARPPRGPRPRPGLGVHDARGARRRPPEHVAVASVGRWRSTR